jgi:lysophospholipase L1-like esterase
MRHFLLRRPGSAGKGACHLSVACYFTGRQCLMRAPEDFRTSAFIRNNSIRFLRLSHMKNISMNFVFGALAFIGMTASSFAATPIDPASYKAPVKVACVGDSITQGNGAHGGYDYPSQLQRLLGDKWQVKNFGLWGRTLLKKGDSPYWVQPVFKDSHDFNPDVVIIMLGTNDTKSENWPHRDEFYADYKDLVDSYKNLPGKPRVFVCLPCPGPGPGASGINEANVLLEIPIITKVATDENVDLIDMHTPLVGKKLQPDNIHPNDAGAALLAQAAANALTGKTAPTK